MRGVYFLIPLYNEAKVISKVLQDVMSHDCSNIVVVNDGSKDESAQIVRGFKNVILIDHLLNQGQGAALATGFEYLSDVGDCEYIVTFDADGQHQAGDALNMVKILQANKDLDVILGSRFLGQRTSNIPFVRKLTLKLGVLFVRFVYGLPISDASNGLRVIRKSVIPKIIPRLNDFSHSPEIIGLIKMHRLNYQEYPTDISYSEYSMSKGIHSSYAIRMALKTIFNKMHLLFLKP